MRLQKYINEAVDKSLGITFVDIDETLFYTFARVMVRKDDEIIHKLTNAEYNAYTLKPGEKWDYSEFRSAKIFYETSKPIQSILKKIGIIVDRADKKGSKVILLTARADFNDKNTFLKTFRKYGFPVDKTYIERAGNEQMKTGGSIPKVKQNIVIRYLNDGLYRRARIFDDFLENCKFFLSIKENIPNEIIQKIRETYDIPDNVPDDEVITFEAYHVQTDGSVRRII